METDPINPTTRFSNRVSYYVRHRPGYPLAVLDFLAEELKLTPASVIADVGSGTGLLAELFLKNGNPLYGVEPNPDMRAAAETLLQSYPNFHSVRGRAEDTTLPGQSVDFVTAGQAFHWFEVEQAGQEFRRILKPDGWVVLVWNERQAGASPLMQKYEELLRRYAAGFGEARCNDADEQVFERFFSSFQERRFPNFQLLDAEGLAGRLLSSSYAPLPGDPRHEPMLAGLARLFEEHQAGGAVRFEYETQVYYGRL